MAQLSFGKKKRRVNYDLLRDTVIWALQITLVCTIAFVFVYFFGQRVNVIGSAMYPELENGDVVIINRFVYDARKPKRGEVVAFQVNGNENFQYSIRRVIGLPGETIEYREGSLWIDGKKLKEEYNTTEMTELGLLEEPVTVGKDEFFVLGDDRQIAQDSRTANIGNVKRTEIAGKVWFVISPMSHFGFVK